MHLFIFAILGMIAAGFALSITVCIAILMLYILKHIGKDDMPAQFTPDPFISKEKEL